MTKTVALSRNRGKLSRKRGTNCGLGLAQMRKKVLYYRCYSRGDIPERRRRLQGEQTMKIRLILELYDKLAYGEVVSREEFCNKHGISSRTFYRYMCEIEAHLFAHSGGNFHGVEHAAGNYYLNGKSYSRQRDAGKLKR
jgi:hypothetical protein